MNTATDSRIEAFRQKVERLTSIPGQLQTIGITLARAIELPGIAARCACPLDTARFREEQIAIGSPLALRFRKVQLENELRQGWGVVGAKMRVASDAATGHVVTAAGGLEAAKSLPFARRHLVQLARHRHLSATASTDDRLAFLNSAWLAIDAAMASLGEIRFEARHRA